MSLKQKAECEKISVSIECRKRTNFVDRCQKLWLNKMLENCFFRFFYDCNFAQEGFFTTQQQREM